MVSQVALGWFIAGAILCGMEVVFPTAFTAFMMGVAALVVGMGLTILGPILFPTPLQGIAWILLSGILISGSRRWLKVRKTQANRGDDEEGETLTAIEPGAVGRVLFEGNSWRARCADRQLTIPIHTAVYILDREGTTLIVMPRQTLRSEV